MKTQVIDVDTSNRQVIDLTPSAAQFCRSSGSGLLSVFVSHATAGIAVMELGAGSDDDLLAQLDELLPTDDRWSHRHGTRGHGRDHVLPALISPSVVIPVIEGEMTLGTWQSIALIDTNKDNPQRQVRFSFIPG